MRRRPKLQVLLSPALVFPGDRLLTEVVFDVKAETPVDWITIDLRGVVFTAVLVGRQRSIVTRVVYARRLRSEKETLVPGTHRRRVAFDLDQGLPATYRTHLASVSYDLTVHVSIPWWPDRVQTFSVPVGSHTTALQAGTPGTFATSVEGPRGTTPFMELSLDRTQLAVGTILTGSISVQNLRGRRAQRLEVTFVEMQTLTAPYAVVREAGRYPFHVFDGTPPEGDAIPFRVRVPPRLAPTFGAAQLAVSTIVEARLVCLFHDVVVRAPVFVAPEKSQAQSETSWVAPVGRERRALVWRAAAARAGLLYDEENDQIQGTRGAVTIAIRTESRDADMWRSATLAFPILGLDLAITERKWTDALAGDVVKVDDEIFNQRLAAHAREDVQTRAVLTPSFTGALLLFEDVELNDASAVLASRGAAQSNQFLDPFVAAVLRVADELTASYVRIPPPMTFAADLPAWQAFAERLRGRLEVGRMWIHDGHMGTDAVEVGSVWTRGGVVVGSALRVAIDPPLAKPPASPDDPDVSPAARGLWRELASQVASIHVDASEIALELRGKLADPAAAAPLLDLGVALRRALGRASGSGPFR